MKELKIISELIKKNELKLAKKVVNVTKKEEIKEGDRVIVILSKGFFREREGIVLTVKNKKYKVKLLDSKKIVVVTRDELEKF